MRYEVIAAKRVMGDTRTKADALRYADELLDDPSNAETTVKVSIWDRYDRHWVTHDRQHDRERP